jgi:hypothetical protein
MQGCDRLNIDAYLVGLDAESLAKPRPLAQRLYSNDQMKTVEPGPAGGSRDEWSR